MAETAHVVAKNLSHNVPAAIEAAKNPLTDLATLLAVMCVAPRAAARKIPIEIQLIQLHAKDRCFSLHYSGNRS